MASPPDILTARADPQRGSNGEPGSRLLVHLAVSRIFDAIKTLLEEPAAREAMERLLEGVKQFEPHAGVLDGWLGVEAANEIIRIISDADLWITRIHFVALSETDYAASIRRSQESWPDVQRMYELLDWHLRAMRGRLRFIEVTPAANPASKTAEIAGFKPTPIGLAIMEKLKESPRRLTREKLLKLLTLRRDDARCSSLVTLRKHLESLMKVGLVEDDGGLYLTASGISKLSENLSAN